MLKGDPDRNTIVCICFADDLQDFIISALKKKEKKTDGEINVLFLFLW